MISKARIKYLKISPRKLRLVLPLVRNKSVSMALATLEHTNKKASLLVYKAIASAAANAKRFPNVSEEDLYVSQIFADGGPMLKRFKARPMGMANTIRKRTSHLTVELDSRKPVFESASTIADKKPKTKSIKRVHKAKKQTTQSKSSVRKKTTTKKAVHREVK